ncbi:MAG: hypothetical protein AAGD25_14495 [Cyanobacteria bacterium P01_F01_bin.150]
MIHLPNLRKVAVAIAFSTASIVVGPIEAWATPRIDLLDAGVMEKVSSNPRVLETVVPAFIRIETDEPIRINITSPFLSNGPDADPSGTDRHLVIRQRGRSLRQAGNRFFDIPAGTTDLEVSMEIERPQDFLPGRYVYQFDLVVSD